MVALADKQAEVDQVIFFINDMPAKQAEVDQVIFFMNDMPEVFHE